ncbi:MAG: hypothetical protein H7Y22_03315 [Gemmatimonadaceae bacterium]|nr:hypothetical protein [Gloeobacterales cyanobacterium ES-bin-141]
MRGWIAAIVLAGGLNLAVTAPASPDEVPTVLAPEDTPEEVLRLEEPDYAFSPVDGTRLTLGEYAHLQAELAEAQEVAPQISPRIKQLIFLLKARKVLRTFLPFL